MNYNQLIAFGTTHFAISIDGMEANTHDKMCGVKNSWNSVISNIKQLSKQSYVTGSCVITELNINKAPDIIKFISSLGVSDIRFSSSVQFNKLIPFLDRIPEEIRAKHPVLNYRINNILNGRNMRGNNSNKKCYIPLDDMVISNYKHFPCSMHMREGGIAIGDIRRNDKSLKTMAEIRKERREWSDKFNCQDNDICKNCCMDFIVDYNSAVAKYKQKT